MPNNVDIIENEEAGNFLRQNIGHYLYQSKTDQDDENTDDEEQEETHMPPAYLAARGGHAGLLVAALAAAGRRVALCIDNQSFVARRVLLGIAQLLRNTELAPADRRAADADLRDIYLWCSRGVSAVRQRQVNKHAQ